MMNDRFRENFDLKVATGDKKLIALNLHRFTFESRKNDRGPPRAKRNGPRCDQAQAPACRTRYGGIELPRSASSSIDSGRYPHAGSRSTISAVGSATSSARPNR